MMTDHNASTNHSLNISMFTRGWIEGRESLAASTDTSALALQNAILKIQLDETTIKLNEAVNTIGDLLKSNDVVLNVAERDHAAAMDSELLPAASNVSNTISPLPIRLSAAISKMPCNHLPPPPSSLPPAPKPQPTIVSFSKLTDINGYYDHDPSPSISLSTTIALDELFAAAQAGSESKLAKIKELCRQAHATPADSKTPAMSYVLSNWRKPVEGSAPGIINPRKESSTEYWARYLKIHSSSWPKGVRKEPDGGPNFRDLSASRIFSKLRPASNAPSALRTEFVRKSLDLFLATGMYRQMIVKEGMRVRPKPEFANFQGVGTGAELTARDIAKHYADCGITVEEIEQSVEPWAQQYAMVTHR